MSSYNLLRAASGSGCKTFLTLTRTGSGSCEKEVEGPRLCVDRGAIMNVYMSFDRWTMFSSVDYYYMCNWHKLNSTSKDFKKKSVGWLGRSVVSDPW